MPYKDKERQKQKQNPARRYQCPFCHTTHLSCGQTGRKSEVCEECYPRYRQAYNIVEACRYRAKKNNFPFDLDVHWLMEQLNKNCPKTNLPFKLNSSSTMADRPINGPSVDKIDPAKGYVKSNCQVVSWWYNVCKQRLSEKEVLSLCQAVVDSSKMKRAPLVKREEKIAMGTT